MSVWETAGERHEARHKRLLSLAAARQDLRNQAAQQELIVKLPRET